MEGLANERHVPSFNFYVLEQVAMKLSYKHYCITWFTYFVYKQLVFTEYWTRCIVVQLFSMLESTMMVLQLLLELLYNQRVSMSVGYTFKHW